MKISKSEKIIFDSDLHILLVLRPFSINQQFMGYVRSMLALVNDSLSKSSSRCIVIIEKIIAKNTFFRQQSEELSGLFQRVSLQTLQRLDNTNYIAPVSATDSEGALSDPSPGDSRFADFNP